MKIFTTLGILAAFGLVVACSSEGSSTGTGGAAGASTGGGGTTSGGAGGAGGTTSGGSGGMAGSSTSGGGTTSGGSGGMAGGGGGSACSDCLSANCTSELTACAGSADCLAALDCAQNCTDETCINACIAQYPNAKTLIDAMLACVQTNCATDCGM